MSLPIRHVLIIGGGLAGPCLALALAARSIRSTIFEIRPTRGDSGGSISLGPNALLVLDRYAGVYEQIRAAGFTYRRFTAYTDDGEKLGEIVASADEAEYPAVRILRPVLHGILLDAAEASGMVDVKYGSTITKIEESDDGVQAHFEDGSSAEGDILIGADGVHSKVRDHVLGTGKSQAPVFEDIIVVSGFISADSVVAPTPNFFPAFLFTSSGVLMTIPIDAEGKTLAWGINTTAANRSRAEWRELESSGEAARLAKDNYKDITTEPVRSLLDNADDKLAKLWAPSSLPDIPTWHSSRCPLIGDAAHALPANGQGSAMAYEDAAILTRLLTSTAHSSFSELFARFEEIRRPRIEGLRKSSKVSGALKGQTGPWMWYFKKVAFRLFFWKNGGVLYHTGETTFDVDEVEL
ncbi:hypothetical protein RQP46_008672 [Phenoliferia psychrophenolica]